MSEAPEIQNPQITDNRGQDNGQRIMVRHAQEGDVDMILSALTASMELYRNHSGIPDGKLEALFETREKLLIEIRDVPFFVAILPDGTVVGSVRMRSVDLHEIFSPESADTVRIPLENGQVVGYFSRFSVLPEMHNLGIGAMLYQVAEDEARRFGLTYLCLHTALANEAMVAFYGRRGFVLWQTDATRGYVRGFFAKKL